MSLSEFLAALAVDKPQSSPTARISWAKKGSGTKVKTDGYLNHYLCENLRQKSMVPILSQCRARTLEQFGPLLKHDAEEFVFVVRGRVEVHTEYYGTEILNARRRRLSRQQYGARLSQGVGRRRLDPVGQLHHKGT